MKKNLNKKQFLFELSTQKFKTGEIQIKNYDSFPSFYSNNKSAKSEL
jgi:hypothetical protein